MNDWVRKWQALIGMVGKDLDGDFGERTFLRGKTGWKAPVQVSAPVTTPYDAPVAAPSVIRQGSAGYPVNEVVLHCAAVKADWYIDKTPAEAKAEVHRWHLARGFSGFGYHALVMPDGKSIAGRPYTQIGAHVMERNRGTIGILMIESNTITSIGEFGDWFTEAQRLSVRKLIGALAGIRWVTGHNDYANKLCPGFKVESADWL